jgi:hypothetical protein
MRLLQTAWLHASQASPFQVIPWGDDESVWTTGPCIQWGEVQASLDGEAAPAALPTGSHTFAVTFADCTGGDAMAAVSLNGAVSAAYVTTDWNELTAVVSANSMSILCCSGGYDFTANGGGTWTRVRTAHTMIYAPAIGATLINNRTKNVVTFGGGSYSSGYRPTPYGGWLHSGPEGFDNLTVAIGATSYIIHGSIELGPLYRVGDPGEVRIASNGTLVARVYRDANGMLRTEVLSPVASF